jgi:hypothetical protein
LWGYAVGGEIKVVDRVRVGGVRCSLGEGVALIELEKTLKARSVKTGYGRLFFNDEKVFSAGFKHLSIDADVKPAPGGSFSISLNLKEAAGLLRDFKGVLCAPAAKIDIPIGRDIWILLFIPVNSKPRIEVSKPLLIIDKASVRASLSVDGGGLRYSLSAYGSGFRRAGLILDRRVVTGMIERVMLAERLVVAHPGESIQGVWTPLAGPKEPVLAFMRPYMYRRDIVALLQALGCEAKASPFISFMPNPFVVGDGGPTQYRIRLTLNGKTVDEALLKVSFQR